MTFSTAKDIDFICFSGFYCLGVYLDITCLYFRLGQKGYLASKFNHFPNLKSIYKISKKDCLL